VVQKSTRFYASGKPSDDLERNGTQVKEGFYAEDGIKRREKLWDESSRARSLAA